MSDRKKFLKYVLYLASSSQSRKNLLTEAQIPFALVAQTADESVVALDKPLPEIVQNIAELKMRHVQIPDGKAEGQIVFVLTADTLTLKGNPDNFEVFGKPTDRENARYMLRKAREGALVGTAFCVQKLVWKDFSWHKLDEQSGYAESFVLVDIPEHFIEFYLDHIDYENVSGAIKVRGLCEQFIREIRGNYSTIIGLPMFELRETLERMGFYE